MKILLVHNYYLQPGGEDVAFRSEYELLRKHGHTVQTFEDNNSRIAQLNPFATAVETIWSESSRQRLLWHLQKQKPEIVHFQNTFPLISPSAYYACRKAGAAVVQTLHNFRLLCPVATLYRDGHICEDCVGRPISWPGILHACYHDSYIHSAVLTSMLAVHRTLRTWQNRVDAYVALTKFAREKYIEGGLPAHKIYLKPNFTAHIPEQKLVNGSFALYVGRLSEEKGIRTMLAAWKSFSVPLKIAGDGPLRQDLLEKLNSSQIQAIEYLGPLSQEEVQRLMAQAGILIFPSEWYEGFPLAIAEALACGLPIVTSNLGSQAEIVQDGYSGLHFRAGDSTDLREKVQWCFDHPVEVLRMGGNARQEYEEKYTPEKNYQQLMGIYSRALENRV